MRQDHAGRNPSALALSYSARALALTLLVGAGFAQGLAAQTDVTIPRFEVNQAIQRGNTPLVGDRTTFVRTTVALPTDPGVPVFVDGLMRVYDGGVEIAGSPFFSDNGPFEVPTPTVSLLNENDTLNFTFLAPLSDDVMIEVEVNPAGPNAIAEIDLSNNLSSMSGLVFGEQRVIEMVYAPIDYRPGGGGVPNLPDPALIEPGVGDNFIQGIYPVADWHYRPIDSGSKLWTQSVSGSGSALNNSLSNDLALMSPQPDFIYGWIPGSIPYNGQAQLPGNAAMGNTQPIRHQRTFAHELGHNHGLPHNFVNTTGVVGVDVEHHLAITQSLPKIKPPTLRDIMYPGLLTDQAWVNSDNYNYFYDHPVYDPVAPLTKGGTNLLVTGLWNTDTGAVELTDVLTIPGGRSTAPAAAGQADFAIRLWSSGTLVREHLVAAGNATDDDSCGVSSDADSAFVGTPMASFSATIPVSEPIDRIVISGVGSRAVTTVDRTASATAPQVAFTSLVDGALADGRPVVTWSGSDADGDALTYYLRYSSDGERFVPLATGVSTTSLDVDLTTLPALQDGQGFFELFASDGVHTTRVRSAALTGGTAFLGVGGAPPTVHVLTPDTGGSVAFGATLILHSSGWDLEDRALDGTSIEWTSDVDGFVGNGRLTSVADLSVGTHVLTVQATDSGSLTATATTTVTVVDRELPLTGGGICQTDLGFGGPGASVLSVCGGDLSTGTTADMLLTNAPPLTTAFLLMGVSNSPTPFKGGQLVPVPWLLLLAQTTDGDGKIEIAGIPGGDGPVSLYAQYVLVDTDQPLGFGLSNAVQIDLLP